MKVGSPGEGCLHVFCSSLHWGIATNTYRCVGCGLEISSATLQRGRATGDMKKVATEFMGILFIGSVPEDKEEQNAKKG